MRAWQVHELGDPIDRLVLGEVDPPAPGPGRLVVDTEAVGLAFPDVLQVRGEYQVKPPLPFTPGSETAGTVVSVGDGVSTDLIGRRVVALGGGLAEQTELPASQVFEVPEGLSSASKEFDQDPAAPKGAYWFGARLRDTHDLHHVLTGYNRDLVGEASLLAFTWAQTRNRGIGAIVLMAYIRSGKDNPAARGMIREGYRRGRKAAWFPEQDWEQLLTQPLEEVREHLRLGDLPVYDEVRSEGAPALA